MSSILIAGATGFIGSHALLAALENPSVASITVLSRRALQPVDNPAKLTAEQLASPKLNVIQHADFATYPDETVAALRDARLDAVVWCLGRPRDGMDVHMGFTKACVTVLQKLRDERTASSSSSADHGKFRFVYVSGAAVVRDQDASVWLLGGVRKQRGLVESFVAELEDKDRHHSWESYVTRPGVVTQGTPFWTLPVPKAFVIPARELGIALVDVAVQGAKQRTLESLELRERGAKILAGDKAAGSTST